MMRCTKSGWVFAVLSGALVALGCQQSSPPKPVETAPAQEQAAEKPAVTQSSPQETAPGEAAAPGQASAAETPAPEAPPNTPLPPAKVPDVLLSEDQLKTCLVKSGESMPDAKLKDLGGVEQSVRGLYGKQFTVLTFWKSGDVYKQMEAADLLSFLQNSVAARFADKGVKVIAVDVGDAPEAVKSVTTEAHATYPVLLDADGQYFGQVALEKLPRVYLLDSVGKVVWFDLDYSNTTRENLKLSLEVVTGLR
jgi:peroxiredoxin